MENIFKRMVDGFQTGIFVYGFDSHPYAWPGAIPFIFGQLPVTSPGSWSFLLLICAILRVVKARRRYISIKGQLSTERRKDMEARLDDYRETTPNAMEKCVIANGALFTGTIECESEINVAVYGALIGDVKTGGALEVSGAITGNISAESFHSDCAKITGSIEVRDSAVIGSDALILGDVSGTDIEITGAVKGNVNARGKVSLGKTAVIKGNIKSRSMTMEDGAAIDGQCEQCYAEKPAARFFEELEGGAVLDKDPVNEPVEFSSLTDLDPASVDDFNDGEDEYMEESPIGEVAAGI